MVLELALLGLIAFIAWPFVHRLLVAWDQWVERRLLAGARQVRRWKKRRKK